MTFKQLFDTLSCDTRIAIDYKMERYTYKVADLGEDFLFYEQIKDCIVDEVWYSKIYGAIVIELES